MLSVSKVAEAMFCLVLMLTVGHPVAAVRVVLVVHNSLADQRARRIVKGWPSAFDNTPLRDHYEDVVGESVFSDPQQVPDWVLDRQTAVAPDLFLASPLWTDLYRGRRRHLGRSAGMRLIDRHLSSLGLSHSGRPRQEKAAETVLDGRQAVGG